MSQHLEVRLRLCVRELICVKHQHAVSLLRTSFFDHDEATFCSTHLTPECCSRILPGAAPPRPPPRADRGTAAAASLSWLQIAAAVHLSHGWTAWSLEVSLSRRD